METTLRSEERNIRDLIDEYGAQYPACSAGRLAVAMLDADAYLWSSAPAETWIATTTLTTETTKGAPATIYCKA